jgi:outer membrane usher protein
MSINTRHYLLGLCSFLIVPVAQPIELYFDPEALDSRGEGVVADLDIFARGGQLPGTYSVDIFLNQSLVNHRDVVFVMENDVLRPQLTLKDLTAMGVNTEAFPDLKALGPDALVMDLGKYIPEAETRFDFSKTRLDILVPQAALRFDARNAVDPALWDQGLTAFLLNYNLNGSHNSYGNAGKSDNVFMSLGSGANFGAWRLRNNATYNYSTNSGKRRVLSSSESDAQNHRDEEYKSSQKKWQSLNTYIQRDIQSVNGQLTLGESNTSGSLFDSMQFRGVQLASDDSMLPDSQRGFAPVVRGIAKSSAQITIRQNGYVIYQTYVAPGPYAIRDLYATTGSGDLHVTVREENGSEETFVQPYSSVPLMQRDGRLRYEFTVGQYRSRSDFSREPIFGQGSLIYGLSNTTTLYGGITGSSEYHSLLAGVGQGLGVFGSLSADINQANTQLQDGSQHQGQSYRLQYAKDLFQSGTTFTLAGYRYSTSGFYDFKEANDALPKREDDSTPRRYNKRSKMQLQVTQSMGKWGSLYFNGYQQNYWGQTGYERTLGGGYTLNLKDITYSLTINTTQSPSRSANNQIAFSIQIPLGRYLSNSWATFNTQTDRYRTTQSATLSGTALENNNLSYSMRQSQGNNHQGNTGGASADYKGTYGNVQSSYSYTSDTKQFTGGVQGGIVAHPYGVTLSQPLGETITLVKADGASGVNIQNQTGVKTDWRGFAVIPFATNYRENSVALDTESFDQDVDVIDTVKKVVPTRGALVMANFKTRVGSRALIKLLFGQNYVPFGATASFENNSEQLGSGIVGESGEIYLSGLPDKTRLKVKWGNEAEQSCLADLSLQGIEAVGGVKRLTARCIGTTSHPQ